MIEDKANLRAFQERFLEGSKNLPWLLYYVRVTVKIQFTILSWKKYIYYFTDGDLYADGGRTRHYRWSAHGKFMTVYYSFLNIIK